MTMQDDDYEVEFEDDDFEDEDLDPNGEDEDENFEDEDEDEPSDEDDELAEFSAEQRKKIVARQKRLEEDRDEAIKFASAADATAKRYHARLTDVEKFAVGEVKNSAAVNLKILKEQLKEAIEVGDADKQVELNEKISDAVMRSNAAQQAEEDLKNRPPEREAPAASPADQDRYNVWMKKNGSWFDPSGNSGDMEMTAVALAAHEKAIRSGTKVNSPEYYAKIDERMAQLYPDKFKVAKKKSDSPKGGSAAAPVSRRPSGGQPGGKATFRITASQRRVAKRLGIPEEQYVKEFIAYEKRTNQADD